MRLTFREIAVLLTIPATISAAYFFVFKEMGEQRAFLRKDTEAKRQTLETLRRTNASVMQIERQIDELGSTMDYFESRLPREREVDQILRQAWMLAENNGLTTLAVKPLKAERSKQPQTRAGADEQPIEMNFVGSYVGFHRFLVELETLDRITQVRTMDLKKMDSDSNRMTARIVLSIFFEPETTPAPAATASTVSASK
jgi:Tfp pilus assembly protein PilO